MSSEEKTVQERIKEMREEELVDFIRVDVIPQLESLASRLESYVDQNRNQGQDDGESDSPGGREQFTADDQGSQRSSTQGLSEERRGGESLHEEKNLVPSGASGDPVLVNRTRGFLLRYHLNYRSLFYRREPSSSV